MPNIEEALRRIAHAKATHATTLDLSGLELEKLPEALRELTWLEELRVNAGQDRYTGRQKRTLKQVPRWINELNKLQVLVIRGGLLTQFSELKYYTKLRSLDLSANEFEQLPELVYLDQLQYLSLNENNFRTLPELSNLTRLRYLILYSNQFGELPELRHLRQLALLNLSYNRITILSELPYLQKLWVLIINKNNLTELPNLQYLTELKQIHISENPLNIPNEMIPIRYTEDFNEEIQQRTLAFLRQLWQGSRTLNEAKVILVGQGDVGKTSLVNRLIEDRFDPNEGKTNGIVIKQWQIQPHDAPIQLNLWDFGGQEIMHATHQFFLTKRSVYLLVLDARQDERANRVEYWLKIIASVASDAPVIIVGNQSDQHPLDLDERGLKLKYPQIKAIIPTSCKTGAGIQQVRHQIEQEIGAMKHVHDLVPLKWWDVKGEIEQWQSDFISHDRFEEICVKHGIADEFVQAVLLRLLNDLGTVLSYNDDPRLADTNVLKPEWITNGVYTLLNHKPLLERKHGILNIKDVPKILNDSKRYPAHRCHYITEMMEKFELCFHLEGEHDRVLIPDLLPKDAPDTGDWDDALHFRYRYPILPTSIMSRFIVRSQQSIEDDLRWRTGVVLRSNEGNRAQIVSDVEAAQIDIRITGADAGRRRFLSAIRYTFEQIHNSMSGIKSEVKEYVPLPDHPDRLVDYAELLGLEEMGEDRYVDGVLRKRFDLQQLLDGYESPKERRANRIKGDYENQEIEHLRDLVDIKRDALRVLENQRAQFGELHVPHHVVTQIETLTNEIGYIEEVMRKRR